MATTWRPASFRVAQLPEGDPTKLRELASWYRDFAERAGSAMIWEARLLTAEDLDAMADRIERLSGTVRQELTVAISAKPILKVGDGSR